MSLKKIHLNNFRSFNNFNSELKSKNLIIGKNGAGKSSFLEAIFFVLTKKSFRTSSLNSLINFDSDNFAVSANWNDSKIALSKKNNQSVKIHTDNLEELKPSLSLVLNNFSLNLLEAPKENRRLFVDYILFHVEQDYKSLHLNFKKSLAQRNRALKKGSNSELKSWTKVFVEVSTKITDIKLNLISSFVENFPLFLKSLSLPENLKDKFKFLSISFDKGWKKNLIEELRACYVVDRKRGFTSIGPQTSDLSIKINEQESGNVLSRGEQKLLILLIYLFFIDMQSNISSNTPIFLIDDLPSELDSRNLDIALNLIQDARCQIFITSLENLEKYEFDMVIDL